MKYKKRNYFCLFPIFLLCFSCSKPSSTQPEPTRPQIEVTEDITKDTIWESGNDYIIRKTIVVEENIKLKINPDVRVFFERSDDEIIRLDIFGEINACGTDTSSGAILFKCNNSLKNSYIEINSASQISKFKFCKFSNMEYGLKFYKSSFIVDYCNFVNCTIGISSSKSDSLKISNSEMISNTKSIKIEQANSDNVKRIEIIQNKILESQNIGVEVISTTATLDNNYFKDNNIACSFSWECDLIFSRNSIFESETGLDISYNTMGLFSYNVFDNCKNGIHIYRYSNPTINNNNILKCSDFNLIMGEFSDNYIVDATRNYWGTNSDPEIENCILDAKDENAPTKSGYVIFKPFENTIYENCGSTIGE